MPKRILIVDDHRDVARLLHNYLELKNYQVDESYSGSDAMKRIFSDEYDLVLLDYDMRDIKGDRICQMTRSDSKMRRLPVILVTAHVEIDDHIFREYGATDVIYKPVDSEELFSKIEKYIGK
jgi:DNA-binding response OmpR family regulator